jgi:IS30 family transposase
MPGIAMGAKYSHFTLDERCRLRGMIEMGLAPGEIARRLGRHRGTIHREIARNRCASGYRPDSADRMAWVRKLRGPKIQRSKAFAITWETALPWDGRRKRSPGGWSWME